MLTQKDFLLNSCSTTSFPRNNNSYNLHTTKIICFILIILSILIPVRSHVVKRASTCNTSKSPEETPPTTLFCSPEEGSEYKVGQIVNLSWNPYNPSLAIETEVEVYLLRQQQNTSGIEDTIILNPKISTAYLLEPIEENSIDFTVESGWFPDYNNSIPNENSKHTFVFRVIPKGHYENLNLDIYKSKEFIAIESKPTLKSEPVASISVKTVQAAAPTNTVTPPINSGDQKKDKSEKNVFNVFIAVASVAAFLAFIAIVIAIRNRKRVNNQTKQSLSNLSMSSSTPMITPLSIGKFGSNNRDSESPVEAESIHSTTPLANKDEMRLNPKSKVSFENQPISASDAALLSDAFRKVLRKPDWKPEDDEDDDTNLSQEERLRRREAKELMKKELAEEGTDLQNISIRHTKVEIRNISDELGKDGASLSSESESK
ncbi:uncharacterized protein OCT59_013106 [Rhizophagus irregularis]|uniref:Uncharacterized protein n=4 Tax=Rhizophagus irregularis TaxID=588596 RepID=A0A916EAS9_9GLOM|nr:hypothetical protein GLOIN_2v1572825 [Rhizophagus irregularis DAOM 181602=DAOM 197198]EXX71498.1 hypothetical protein RirG_078010 [Rhizophagus irregularis DAOM 197198w]UZO20684.1 hypothetical protein OCT59_013106 [Rhizophagus irregularis]POG74744.1 hypothetical protein GLOIN_2v1572825 [Rhizophagus irregularis DAOM 181602=DAOM 197198]CAB4477541.1 unnamed protein product [Rhizophagus irregularis]CAB5206574.1 unnamed protein product [Rhizophagus irregularis]|eukprot:XP_025181610.1 hypothetical protein GLOIN_2v1572825 [Rhizophagus irregularis DAOM 181602=DAOM 197198]